MTKKKKEDSQGEIIDELRKARAQVWREYKANPKKFFEKSQKLAKQLGIRYGSPRKKSSPEQEGAA